MAANVVQLLKERGSLFSNGGTRKRVLRCLVTYGESCALPIPQWGVACDLAMTIRSIGTQRQLLWFAVLAASTEHMHQSQRLAVSIKTTSCVTRSFNQAQ